jgi:heat shock 70kDa protein 1/2/6/8
MGKRRACVFSSSSFFPSNTTLTHHPTPSHPSPQSKPTQFDIDANGILSVTATDKGTGKAQDIKITGASTLSSDDVDRMVKDAEAFADEDRAKREAVDTRNAADSMVYQADKQLKEFGDKVPADLKTKVEAAQAKLKDAIAKEDVAGMKAGMEALQAEVMAIGQAVYSAGGAAGAGGAGAPGGEAGGEGASGPSSSAGGGDDTVIDADFTDTK